MVNNNNNNLGRRISSISGDTRETSHLYQRVSVLVQRFNAFLLHDSLPVPDCTDASAAIQRRAATRFFCIRGLPGVMVTPTIFFYFFPNPSGSLIPRVNNNNNITSDNPHCAPGFRPEKRPWANFPVARTMNGHTNLPYHQLIQSAAIAIL